jgi:ankyrin repeat protein
MNHQNNAARLLLLGGADPHPADSDGETPLVAATAKNRINTVQLFLDWGVYIGNKVGASSEELGLALCVACEGGFLEVAKLLVNRGADTSFRTTSGQTPLLAAVRGGHLEVISLLFDESGFTHEVYENHSTLLHHASGIENPHVAKLLLERGADIEAKNIWDMRPIHHASFHGRVGTVKLLVESGADTKVKSYDGRTPLSYAAGRGHKSVVQLLLSKWRDGPNPSDYCCRDILHYACLEGRDEIVKLLIQAAEEKPSLDQRDHWGSTPLSFAVRRGHIDVVTTLLATKLVDSTSEDDLGRTIVWWAMRQQQAEILNLLTGTNERLPFGSEEDHRLEVPGALYSYCDICCFGSSKTSFYTCDICLGANADLCVCLECFTHGGHCFDISHQLLLTECN